METDKAADIVTNKSFLPPCSSSADGDNCSNQQFAGSKAVSLPAAAAKVVDPDSNNNNNDSLQQTTALNKSTTASAKVPLKKDATSTNADVNVVSDHRRIILNAIQQPVVPCIWAASPSGANSNHNCPIYNLSFLHKICPDSQTGMFFTHIFEFNTRL